MFKKWILGICAFANLSIGAQDPDVRTAQIDLKSLYRIEEGVLINHEGRRFPQIPFKDALHEELHYTLKDPEQAEIVYKAYERRILPHFSKEMQQAFGNALLKVCMFFGANTFSPEETLIAALREEQAAFFNTFMEQRDTLKAFVEEANRPARPNPAPREDTSVYTVVILTTSASGGNNSVANAMQHFLSTSKNVRCIVIDAETVTEKTDLLMLATGVTTYDGIYATHFQMANQGMDCLLWRDVLSKEMGKYIPSRLGAELKELMREIRPDLILSTRSYNYDDIALCTLGIPFRMIHPDYELSLLLMNLYGKVQPDMMKFWFPSLEPQIFLPLFHKTGRMDLYNADDDCDTLMVKLAEITHQPIENIQGQFELIGYPVNPEFRAIEDTGPLRQKWNLPPDEAQVLISMGKNGVGVLEEMLDQLLGSPSKFPIRYHIVCGKNARLKARLQEKAAQSGAYPKFSIHGLISPKEMNELMNLSTVQISKPGGAISSEALATGTYLLIMCPHPWEIANGAKIEREGAGQKILEGKPIAEQVEECIEKRRHLKKQAFPHADWKKLLEEHIEEIQSEAQS